MVIFPSDHCKSYKVAITTLVGLAWQVRRSLGKMLIGNVPQTLWSKKKKRMKTKKEKYKTISGPAHLPRLSYIPMRSPNYVLQ